LLVAGAAVALADAMRALQVAKAEAHRNRNTPRKPRRKPARPQAPCGRDGRVSIDLARREPPVAFP
jgi:hypothetical protein